MLECVCARLTELLGVHIEAAHPFDRGDRNVIVHTEPWPCVFMVGGHEFAEARLDSTRLLGWLLWKTGRLTGRKAS